MALKDQSQITAILWSTGGTKDTLSASGTVGGAPVAGSVLFIEAVDTAAIIGMVGAGGNLGATEIADTVLITATGKIIGTAFILEYIPQITGIAYISENS